MKFGDLDFWLRTDLSRALHVCHLYMMEGFACLNEPRSYVVRGNSTRVSQGKLVLGDKLGHE